MLTDVGTSGSASVYGTFDQAGNVHEWGEDGGFGRLFWVREVLGRGWGGGYDEALISGESFHWQGTGSPEFEYNDLGFRIVYIPEPSTALLVIMGCVALMFRRRPLVA